MKKIIFFFLLLANLSVIGQVTNKIIAKEYQYKNNSSEKFLPADLVKTEGYVLTFKNTLTIYDGEIKIDLTINKIALDTTMKGKKLTIYKVTDSNKISCLLTIIINPSEKVDLFTLQYDKVSFTWVVEH